MMFINCILEGMLPFNDKRILKTANSMADLRDTIRSRVDSRTTMLNYERRGCIRYKNYKRLKEVEDELIKIRILQDSIINDMRNVRISKRCEVSAFRLVVFHTLRFSSVFKITPLATFIKHNMKYRDKIFFNKNKKYEIGRFDESTPYLKMRKKTKKKW